MITNPNENAFASTSNYKEFNGLTKREYFAAQAMLSLIIEGKGYNELGTQIKPMCSAAVDWADCLIAALNEVKE